MINNKGHVLAFDDSPIGENSPLDSVTYNKIIDSLRSSTLRCINRTRELNDKVTKFNKALLAENTFLSSQYKTQAINYGALSDKQALITGFDNLEAMSSVKQSSLTGQIIMESQNDWSKVVRYQDRNSRYRASRDTTISFGLTAGSILPQPADSDIYSMLDGYMDTFWLVDVVDKNQYTLRIEFPVSLKPYVDYLTIIPFPAFGFKIDSIYLTKADGSAIQLADSVSMDMGIVDTHFTPISWGGVIEINMTAQGSVMGISDLNIGLADYVDAEGWFVIKAPALSATSFSSITAVDLSDIRMHNLEDGTYNKNDNIKLTIYQAAHGASWSTSLVGQDIENVGRTTLTNSHTGAASNNEVFIKVSMKKFQGQTPMFRTLKITTE